MVELLKKGICLTKDAGKRLLPYTSISVIALDKDSSGDIWELSICLNDGVQANFSSDSFRDDKSYMDKEEIKTIYNAYKRYLAGKNESFADIE